jgi:uncharacterized protein YbaA (DUF1428 family)
MTYVDGFIVPVPKKKLAAYRSMAKKAGKVWLDHGALSYVECIADDVKKGKRTSFPRSVKLKPGEVVVFSWIAQVPRCHHGQGHERQAAGRDDGPEEDAVRRQAYDLRRLQNHDGIRRLGGLKAATKDRHSRELECEYG